jgi:preprotein translocase subunit YajC
MEATLCIPKTAFLALGAPPTPPGTQPDPRGQMVYTVGMLAFMVFIFYFLIIRPQRVRSRQQESLLKSIKPGDKVVTSSGIIGTVVGVKEKSLSIRSADTKLEILKSAVTEVTASAAEKSAGESS